VRAISLIWALLLGMALMAEARPLATVEARAERDHLVLTWRGDETIEVQVSKARGLFKGPVTITVDGRQIGFDGFYVHMNDLEDGFTLQSTAARLEGDRIVVEQTVRHPELAAPTKLTFTLWLVPSDRALRVEVAVRGDGQELDRLGIGDHLGTGLEAERMFFGRMYVLDRPRAFALKHNYNTCRFWCWRMANGLTELQATGGPARGFAYDPALGRYDLYTFCESPIQYLFLVTGKGPQEAIAEYRETIAIPAPPSLSRLPGRVGVMACYPIRERYQDFLEEWTGKGARDFVWLSYWPTPGDRKLVEPYGALYATYDTYFDAFQQEPRRMAGWSPDKVCYYESGRMITGYWGASRLLPQLYLEAAQNRVMGVFGREYRDDRGQLAFVPSSATRYSNLRIVRQEVKPNALYLDVHAMWPPDHYFDWQHRHYGARTQWQHQKALFDFARQYLGNAPIWSEGGGEDYVGVMDGGWFMDWRPPQEIGIEAAKWQYYPFIDQVHRARLLNMGIYYPLDHYDPEMVGLAILFGRPQAVSVYYGSPQEDVGGRLQVYYLTKAFHRMLGLSLLLRVDFQEDDISRPIVSYSNGAQAWVNRSAADWTVEGYCLPPGGYLVRGPRGFLEYRARQGGAVVDVVRSEEYHYFSSPARADFGPVVTDGALAIAHPAGGKLVIYEVKKPTGAVTLRLGELPGIGKGRRATKAWAVLTRGRQVQLRFPDLRQPAQPPDYAQPGDLVEFRPVEMRTALRYEISFD